MNFGETATMILGIYAVVGIISLGLVVLMIRRHK